MTLFDDTETPAAPAGPLVRVRMTVAYDGTGFHGFAPNPGVPTVGGTLRDALEKVLRAPVELTCAGRTDTGVHAWGQVVSFDAPSERFDPLTLQRAVNRLCGPAVVVREARAAADDFDARRSATGRTYRYTVVNRPVPDPFLAGTAWHVDEPLDLDLLRLGCDPLIGEHDFSAFCRRPKLRDGSEASLVRYVRRAGWSEVGDGVLRFEIEANAFCHQMIRSVVGTLVEVGAGRRHAGELLGILAGRDRAAASKLAPPQGLCLWAVSYPDGISGVPPAG
ncbi:MAG TPA: tRNA pseudouridine(38-40) synthase TruA [Acidimicrobiales bacterium]|nr:tRNA pseudouridine(38-40) synthase TruA [Acidimicrobiales bacterium]